MKITKKLLMKRILFVITLLLFSFLIELLIFNFNSVFLNKNNTTTISNYKINTKNKKEIISFSLKNKYVRKLKLLYSAKEDVKINIYYDTKNYYGKIIHSNKIDRLDNETNIQTLIVNNDVKKVEISYDSGKKLNLKKIYIDNSLYINYFRVTFIFSLLLMIYLSIIMYKNGCKKIHLYYFLIGLLMGVTIIIIQPSTTYYSWDDQIHFKNSKELFGAKFDWSIGEYEMLNEKAIGRDNIDSIEEQEGMNKYLNNIKKSELTTKSGRLIPYSKIAYIPSALGYNISNFFQLPFVFCFKIGKLFNLVAFLFIMSFAIWEAKIGKKLLVTLGLLPSTIFLASQYSYDPAVISGLTLSTVILINWFVDPSYKVNFRSLVIFLISILYACFTKGVYIPLILLFLFIPSSRFGNKRLEVRTKILISFIFLLVSLTFVLPSNFSAESGGDTRGGNVNTSEQIHLILNHPVGYGKILKDTIENQYTDRLIGAATFGSFAYIGEINKFIYIIILFAILFSSISEDGVYSLNRNKKILLISMALAISLLIWTALYLSFTPVGMEFIDGVQNRYFIPLLFLIFICLSSKKIVIKYDFKKIYFILFLIMIFCTMYSIYNLILVKYCF